MPSDFCQMHIRFWQDREDPNVFRAMMIITRTLKNSPKDIRSQDSCCNLEVTYSLVMTLDQNSLDSEPFYNSSPRRSCI